MIRRVRTLDGVEIVADDRGPEDARVIVLMYGGGQTRHSWSGAMRALVGHGYRVVNMDLRGHGNSGWSFEGSYTLDHGVADLRTMLDGLKSDVVSDAGVAAFRALAPQLEVAAVTGAGHMVAGDRNLHQ